MWLEAIAGGADGWRAGLDMPSPCPVPRTPHPFSPRPPFLAHSLSLTPPCGQVPFFAESQPPFGLA